MSRLMRQSLKNISIKQMINEGYNLRSKVAASKPLLAAPEKKKDTTTKQPVAPVK
jgi:hypothetical protein